jgi:hypothetical protein
LRASAFNIGLAIVGGVFALIACGSEVKEGNGAAGGKAGVGSGGLGGPGNAGGTDGGGANGASGASGGGMGQGGAGAESSGGTGGGSGGSGGTGNPLVFGSTMNCGTETFVAPRRIEAECAFGPTVGQCGGVSGGQRGLQLENADTSVGFIEGGDALWFSGIVLDGLEAFTLRYSKGVAGGKIDLRIDAESGPLLATLIPPVTGDWTSWQELTVPLQATSGTHSLYLVASGSTAGILNIDWIRLSAERAGGNVSLIHLNQLGYDTLGPKHAVIEGAETLARFSVVQADGKAIWCGPLSGKPFSAWGSSASFYSVDFTGLTLAGTYRLVVDGTASEPFTVGDRRLFTETAASVLSYFKASRADDAPVWAADAAVPFFGGGRGPADVRGGWYDASGDVSKYLSHLSYANYLNPQQIPLVAWALAWVADEGGAALGASGLTNATRAEALWGADYLVRVLDPAGYFYATVFDGWSGEPGQRQICAFERESGVKTNEWQSALREGGGMSIAALARVARWQTGGEFAPSRYLSAARAAFAHLNQNGAAYADDGKENVIDDYTGLLAASELFATTADPSDLDAARARATSLIARLSPTGMFIADGASRPFWHASDAGLPVLALVRFAQVETDDARRRAAIAAVRAHLDYLLAVTREVDNPFGYARQHTGSSASFFIPHTNESGYWWQGENARLASLAAAALFGASATGAGGDRYLELLRYAGHQLDWVLGKNPRDLCFLHGAGKNNPPAYCGSKPEHGTLEGGIANGITGRNADGSGFQWLSGGSDCGSEWRWVEQWLPHAAWYLVAVTALAR